MIRESLISIVLPTYNEEENIEPLYARLKASVAELPHYKFDFIFIDNASTDRTVEKLEKISNVDARVKVIVNTRNFGHIRSPYYGILQSTGEATIYMASDLQDPPELIKDFLNFWEKGFKVVMAVKPKSEGSPVVHFLRRMYYRVVNRIATVELIQDATGFGLYDKRVVDELKQIGDPYPYLRGLVCELGFPIKTIEFQQPRRQLGISKNNFFSLYDIAWLGIISHSKLPIRLATISGIFIGTISLLFGLVFLILKLLYWDLYPMGIGPLAAGVFFLIGLQMIFIGILGEYISSIHTYVQNRPVVVEKERINF